MKDWKAYIVTKLGSDVWGGIALDYYSTQKVNESKPLTSNEFIDWIIDEISPEYKGLIEFHRVFVGVVVRLFGSDFDKTMQCSIRLLRKHMETPDLAVCTSFVQHYNDYNVADLFKNLLMKSFDMKFPKNDLVTKKPAINDVGKQVDYPKKRVIKKSHTTLRKKKCEVTEQLVRICHISDLHFGFHHELLEYEGIDCKFHKTDHFINFLRDEGTAKRKIDLLIVSGDITSIAADDEYAKFIEFLEEVKKTEVMSQDNFYNRILLVPGNHEARRGDGHERADYLDNFRDFVEKKRSEGVTLSTPYSVEGTDPCVIGKESKEKIPYAMHEYPSLKVRVLTLVSSYYAQGIDKKTLKCMADYEKLKDDWENSGKSLPDLDEVYDEVGKYFKERIRLDTGFFTVDYYGGIKAELHNYFENHTEPDFLKIAVAHHNATDYFQISHVHSSENGLSLLGVLGGLGFPYYLHGHIHNSPPIGDVSGVEQLSASTLGGKPVKGLAGFNILEWAPNSKSGCNIDRYELRDNEYVKMSN